MNLETTRHSDDVLQHAFDVESITGILWTPTVEPFAPRPLVCSIHGGGQHSQHPAAMARATALIEAGLTVLSLDAPGHGRRQPTAEDLEFRATMQERRESGRPFDDLLLSFNARIASQAVPEWLTVLDVLASQDHLSPSQPLGLWGVSLGGVVAMQLLATDERFAAAIVGLVGGPDINDYVERVTAPLLFLMQWDDELVARADALETFDRIGSTSKRLHANPGGHAQIPYAEYGLCVDFLHTTLTTAGLDFGA